MTTDNHRPTLPKSLRKKCIQNVVGRIVSCCLLFALFLIAIIMWGERIFPMPQHSPKSFVGVKFLCYAVFLVLPFLITGVPMKLIDSSWSGVISNLEIKDGIGTYSHAFGRPAIYDKQDLILTINKDDGKTIKHTAVSVGQRYKLNLGNSIPVPNSGKITDHTNDFKVGDRVYKYYGFKYLYVVPSTECDQKRCIVCGQKNDNQRTQCLNCFCDLI